MNKKQYLMATAGVCIIAGLISVVLFSSTGFAIAKVIDPSFYTEIFGEQLVPLLGSLLFIGISLGAVFSGARFLGKIQAIGISMICGLIVILVGSILFWDRMETYTVLAFGLLLGMALGGLFASNAHGTKFGIGFEQTKKVFVVMAIVAFIGTWVTVGLNEDQYKEQFTSAITGLTAVSAGEIDDATLEQMIREQSPKVTWEQFLVQAQITDYDSMPPEQQVLFQELYQNYTTNYEAGVKEAVEIAKQNLAASGGTSETIMQSISFFQVMLDNIAFLYAAALASMILLAESIIVAPFAGLTSWMFQKPLPERLQPKPKHEILEVDWSGE